ncbi:MAG: Hsp70 family protein [Alphaproteobacteria bacterium]|nr:Hsp70 family protein [Alphaproteobacteria bacterium]MCB9697902.1 Hsp70 family protein [Alphaproteobacteria bacterium]
MGKAIGIDLGTTNSCCAFVSNGKPQVITYRDGSRTIPSVFAIDKNGNRLVGNEAKNQAADNPNHTIAASKRLIGRSFGSSAMQKMQQVFTYELVEGDQNEVLIKVADQVFTLEQISAAILRRIKESAEEALNDEVDQAVITVPAYFNDRQRQAVRSAGKLAGLKVLRVLNEPTAAALAYGLGRTLNQRVAIYDLGGGTFDISIIDIKDKIFEVIATGGDTFLGGVDFDDRLMQHVLQNFVEETDIDVSYDRSAVTRIRDASENAKIRLSDVAAVDIHLPHICDDDDGNPVDLSITIDRDKLEELTEDLIDRSIATCERILGEASTSREELDEILLVGGQSRMPLVRSKVEGFLGKPPSDKVHPDEAVAIGAAIMAHSLSSKAGPQDMTLLDVLPMAIGINKVDGQMHVLFAKNQPLPDYKTRVLTTSKENQRSIMLRIYQGESKYVAENELLGTFVFSGLREAPKGQVKIEVTFHIDSEGILNLTARDIDTGQLVESRLKLGKDEDDGPKRRPAVSAQGPSAKKKVKRRDQASAPPEAEAPAGPPPSLDMPMKSSLANQGGPGPRLQNTPDPMPIRSTGSTGKSLPPDSEKQPPAPPKKAEKKGFFAWLLSLFGLG